MLINSKTAGGSAVIEMIVGAALVVAVGFGVYQVQHPHQTQAQQITAAFQQ